MKRKERGRIATLLLMIVMLLTSAGVMAVAHLKKGEPKQDPIYQSELKASVLNETQIEKARI